MPHPPKMWPHIAAEAIARYSKPGQIVLDPMCGIGTTLVEAIRLGRDTVGIDCEPRWARIAAANVRRALSDAPKRCGQVFRGDATDLVATLRGRAVIPVDMVLTSPPYGAFAHGNPTKGTVPVVNRHHRYAQPWQRHRHQLATTSTSRLQAGLVAMFSGCQTVLRPGGYVVVTARPYTEAGILVDFPSQVIRCAIAAGL
ncbi:hypothetical protein JQS30_06280 [Natronoglycomyces albus]|uniref:Methyltransferase n=2 Tax=Natronoglycomyces albus TaxID=2811108 RepID=A0A895XN05_9ACTN|nr:hypothetical protein JQS30_06280 [Natronoglycomyces albus]